AVFSFSLSWSGFRPRNAEGFRVDSCRWEGEMKPTIRSITSTLMLASALSFCLSVSAQQSAQPAAQPDARRVQSYDLSREVSLIGTVVKYDTASSIPPIGAHLTLQTASGQVEAHLGNAKVLQANHLELNPGDSVRIIGEDLAFGSGAVF